MRAKNKIALQGDELQAALRMLDALDDAKASDEWQEENGRFIPHPTSWLNAQRWEDETP